jgi:hypothetical protein
MEFFQLIGNDGVECSHCYGTIVASPNSAEFKLVTCESKR